MIDRYIDWMTGNGSCVYSWDGTKVHTALVYCTLIYHV